MLLVSRFLLPASRPRDPSPVSVTGVSYPFNVTRAPFPASRIRFLLHVSRFPRPESRARWMQVLKGYQPQELQYNPIGCPKGERRAGSQYELLLLLL